MKTRILKLFILSLVVSLSPLSYASNDDHRYEKNSRSRHNVVDQLERILHKLETLDSKLEAGSRKLETLERKLEAGGRQLETLESKLDCDMENYLSGNCDQNPSSASASFCISQGRAAELGLSYAIEAPTTWEGGFGWAEVGDVKATISPVHPTIITAPIGAPIPLAILPNSVGIDAGGSLGRGMDICVEIPIVLTREDTLKLDHLAIDMNTASLLPTTKFQRRAGRIISYAELRAAPNQLLDRADTAVDDLLDNGWESPLDGDNGFQAFRDGNVAELLAVMELPNGVDSVLRDPEQIFNALPDLSEIDLLTCDDFGATSDIRASRPRLNQLCMRLETLPSFDRVRDGLELVADIPDDVVEAITGIMEPMLEDSRVAEKTVATKNRFCQTVAGQRRVFNRLCGR